MENYTEYNDLQVPYSPGENGREPKNPTLPPSIRGGEKDSGGGSEAYKARIRQAIADSYARLSEPKPKHRRHKR